MLRISLILIALLWGFLIAIIGVSLVLVSIIPSSGSILITHNLFLRNQDRFELYDIARQVSYGFTPNLSDDGLFVSLAPSGRRIAIADVDLNQSILKITDYGGNNLIAPVRTRDVLSFGEVHWSSDGRYFLYYDLLGSDASIFILDTVTGDLNSIPYHEGLIASAGWSPDNRQIAYPNFGNNSTLSQIWLADRDGQNQRQLTQNDADAYCPTWSPDGKTIAYVQSVDNGDALHFIMLDGNANGDYIADGIWRMTTCPLWSRDGRSILFIALDEITLRTSVVQVNLRTGQENSLFDVEQTASLQMWR